MNKWRKLSQEMQAENLGDEVFLKERITPERMCEAYERNRAIIVEEADRIVGFGALWETDHPQWLELGSFFVRPDMRGKHLGSDIYRRRLELVPKGMRCFTVTHNPRAAGLAKRHGLIEATREDWYSLAPYVVVCGPCDRDVADKKDCSLRAVIAKCRLFVR